MKEETNIEIDREGEKKKRINRKNWKVRKTLKNGEKIGYNCIVFFAKVIM